MKRIVLLCVSALLLIAVLVLPGCTPTEPTVEPIIFGYLGILTGPGAVAGAPVYDGVMLKAKEINDGGGLLGREVQVIARDTGGVVDNAINMARDLILNEEVDFIIGPFTDGENMAVSALGEEYKIIVMPYDSVTPRLISPAFMHPYIFHHNLNAIYEATYVVQYLAANYEANNWTTVCSIAPDYEYGQEHVVAFKDALDDIMPGVLNWTCELWPDLFETDFVPYITQIKAAQPDILYNVLWGGDFNTFLIQATIENLWPDIGLMTAVGGAGGLENLIPIGDCPDGILVNARGLPYFPETTANQDFVNAYTNFTGDPYPPSMAWQGYMNMNTYATAIEEAGTIDTDAVIAALEGLWTSTPLGPIYMNEDHQLERGIIWGFTKYDEGLGYALLDSPEWVPWSDVLPSLAP